ncbi:hypothetical protein HPB47_001191, partial [Ixodes persulcatus]
GIVGGGGKPQQQPQQQIQWQTFQQQPQRKTPDGTPIPQQQVQWRTLQAVREPGTPAPGVTRPPQTPPGMVQFQQQQPGNPAQVTPKTKTALANLLNTRLQGGGARGPGELGMPEVLGTAVRLPAPVGEDQHVLVREPAMMNPAYRSIRGPLSGPQHVANDGRSFGTEVPVSPNTHVEIHFYGHDPRTQVPLEMCLVGCIFCILDYGRLFDAPTIALWKKVILQRGGEVEEAYSSRCTHVICVTQRDSVVQQAIREGKRCVTVFWLNDVLLRKKLQPPWLALHFPSPYSDDKPCKNQIISSSGFDREERVRLKQMVLATGAKYTTYLTRLNSLLITKKALPQVVLKAIEVVFSSYSLAKEEHIARLESLRREQNQRCKGRRQFNATDNNRATEAKRKREARRRLHSTLAEQFPGATARFRREFVDYPFGITCAMCDQLWREGLKYQKAQEWSISTVNLQWVQDVMLGHYEALRLPMAQKYQQYDAAESTFRLDYSLVPHLMAAWRVPVKLTEEIWKRFTASDAFKEAQKRKLENANSNKSDATTPTKQQRMTPELEENIPLTPATTPGDDKDKSVIQLGGVLAKSPKECTHVVTEKIRRTVKLLSAFGSAKFVVTPRWITDSADCNLFADEKQYAVDDPDAEKTFGFSLEQVLQRADRTPLFKGMIFFITPGVYPSPPLLQEIVESCGGVAYLKKRPTLKQVSTVTQGGTKFLVISCDNDLHLCRDYMAKNINIYSAEFILTGVLRQCVDLDAFLLS